MLEKTPLQSAIQSAYEATFGEAELPLNTGGKPFPTRPDALTDRQITAFFRYGKRALNDSYNSVAKIARDEGTPAPEPGTFFTEWLDEFGTAKARAGGARLSVETAGWIEYYKSKGSSVRFKGKTPNGTNLDEYHDVFVKNAIWPSVRDYLQGMDKEAQRNFHHDELPGLIAKHKPNVLKQAQDDTRTMAPGDRHQPHRRVQHRSSGLAGYARAQVRPRDRDQLSQWPERPVRSGQLCCDQGR